MIKIKKIILILILFLLTLFSTSGVLAASLKFDKTTVNVSNGGTFTIAVTVDPSPDAVTGTDVYVSYDASALKATSVAAGSLFPTVMNDISTSGRVYIAGLVNDPASSVTSAGTLATITFQALKETTVTLTFDCSMSKVIKNDINATNVLICSQNGSSQVTIGAGGSSGSSSTVTPTQAVSSSESTNNETPQELPRSGIMDNMIKFALSGSILLILGGALRLVL